MIKKALILDFDGVIFDSEHIHLEACNQVLLSEFGFEISHEEYFKKYVGIPDLQFIAMLVEESRISADYLSSKEKIMRAKTQAYKKILAEKESLYCVPGLPIFLEKFSELNPKLKLGICSASRREELHSALSRLENGKLKKYFEIITTMDDVIHGKPSPEGYLKTAMALGVDPQDCIVIEDSPNGTAAAKAAGMFVVGILTTHQKEALKAADQTAKTYSEIWERFF